MMVWRFPVFTEFSRIYECGALCRPVQRLFTCLIEWHMLRLVDKK